jgi:type III restriction enzyme
LCSFTRKLVPEKGLAISHATKIKNAGALTKRPIERYEHSDKKRINNPPDTERPIRSTGDMLPWYSGKPCEHTLRSHINMCVYDSRWEANESLELDRNQNVHAWVKNDHIGFEITYSFKGIIHKFRPDYLVRLANGKTLVLEVKGQDDQQQQTKREFLSEWVRAVNGHGGFGEWSADVSRHPKDVLEILERHNK